MPRRYVQKWEELKAILQQDQNPKCDLLCCYCGDPMALKTNTAWGYYSVRLFSQSPSPGVKTDKHFAVALPCGHVLGASCVHQHYANMTVAKGLVAYPECPWCKSKMRLVYPACDHTFSGMPIFADDLAKIPPTPAQLKGYCTDCRVKDATSCISNFVTMAFNLNWNTRVVRVRVDEEAELAGKPHKGAQVWTELGQVRKYENDPLFKQVVDNVYQAIRRCMHTWRDFDTDTLRFGVLLRDSLEKDEEEDAAGTK